MRDQLSYYEEILCVQKLAQEIIDKYDGFIKYVDVWLILKKQNQFFKGYNVFMKYMNTSQVLPKINELKEKKMNSDK